MNFSSLKLNTFVNKRIHSITLWLRKVTLPGFDRVAIYDVVEFFIKGLKKGSLNTRAASIAFNFLLALGPAFIFFLTLLPYLPINNFQHALYSVLNELLPENSFIAIESLLNEIFIKHTGLPIFGLLTSLFFAQKGIHGMTEAFNATYHTIETRTWYRQRVVSIALVFIFYLLVIIAIVLFFVTKLLLDRLVDAEILNFDTYLLLVVGKWILLVGLTFFSISFLYYLAPSRRTVWRFFSAGSTLATLLTIIASLGFTYFMNNFAQLNKFFGSIGAVVAMMLWMNFNALTLLIGFELNASIKNASLGNNEQ